MAKTMRQLQQRIAIHVQRATLKLALVIALCVACVFVLALSVLACRSRQAGTADESSVPAALNLQRALAQRLHVPLDSVQVARVEGRTWSDACLEAPSADEVCAEAKMPGFRIVLVAEDNGSYIYHTDLEGHQDRLVSAPEPAIGKPVLAWSGPDGSDCRTVEIGTEGMALGRCRGLLIAAPFSIEARRADLAEFTVTYASFTTETPVGGLRFVGSGATIASAVEARMIAEWSRSVYLEAMTGGSSVSPTLVLSWHREGGLSGQCGDVTVDVTGDVHVTSCQDDQIMELGSMRLDAAGLAPLFGWMDAIQPFESQRSLADAVEGVVEQLTFSGRGDETMQDADSRWMLDFAQSLYNEAQMAVSSAPDVCLAPIVGQQLLLSQEDRYCLLYPSEYSLFQFTPHRWELLIGTVLDQTGPRVSISVEEASGRALADIATQLEIDFVPPGFDAARSGLTVDGAEAIMFDNLPGQDLNRRVAFLHGARVYSVFLSPLGDEGSELRQDAESLFRQVMGSFRFLDASTDALTAATTQGPPVPVGLVYSQAGALWRGGDDGEPELLVRNDSALLSPDLREAIYFDRPPGETMLWMVDLETQQWLPFASDRVIVHGFGWVDADTVLLGTRDRSAESEGGTDSGHLTALKTATGEFVVLDSESLCSSPPAVSPDGNTIAYSTYEGPRLYRWQGTPQPFDTKRFAASASVTDLSLTSPVWSPDGQKLAWIALGQSDSTGDADAAIMVFDLNARTVETLHPFMPLRYGGLIAAPAWSPDGDWLAFVAITHEGMNGGTWLIAADGSREELLTENVMTNPFWTSDGQLVWNDFEIWVLNPETRTKTSIALSGYAVGWSRH